MLRKITFVLFRNGIKIIVAGVLTFLVYFQKVDLDFKINSSHLKTVSVSNGQGKIVARGTGEHFLPTARNDLMHKFKMTLEEVKDFLAEWFSLSESELSQLKVVDATTIDSFIKRFQRVAILEQEKFGIPASIIIANSMLRSQAGTSKISQKANNFFSIPKTEDWKGETVPLGEVSYRHYENAWTSFRDHSYFFTTGMHSHLRELPATDYRAWARGIADSPTVGDKSYADQLITLIESFELNKLDGVPKQSDE